ncbi:SDR family NAD(P)-dependent oxidoreductase [Paenibacillus alvei]|uniref:SDR family NAD(P)-dependent oxidoreductase n=1 Tax=Paenibacillus alvei TaxID=44250 RepID=UPI00227F6CAB|nr:SDR family NAD(P)-dependent oxidoreductase [Paenibacillus alvei]
MKTVLERFKHKAFTKEEAQLRISSLDKGEFWLTFEYGEPYLQDHTVFGEQVLLGVTHCSMAIEAVNHVQHTFPLQFSRLLFQTPATVKSGESIDIRSRLTMGDDQKQKFTSLYKRSSENTWTEAAVAEIERMEKIEPIQKNIAGVLDEPDRIMQGREIYEKLSKSPVCHGESLRTVEHVYIRDHVVLGRLCLSEEFTSSEGNYIAHPALLDGAIVSSMCGIREARDGAFIPLFIKRVTVFAPLLQRCFSWSEVIKMNSELIETNIYVCDEEGNCLLMLEGVTCKRAESSALLDSSEKEANVAGIHRMINKTESTIVRSNASAEGDYHDPLRSNIEKYLTERVSCLLTEEKTIGDKSKNFMDMGIDSTRLIELARELEVELGIELYPTLFFEYQNILDLSTYFAKQYPEVMRSKLHVPESAASQIPEVGQKDRAAELPFSEPLLSTGSQTSSDDFERTYGAKELQKQSSERDIAVIGMSGMFAGSPDLPSFWNNIREGVDLMQEIPHEHFDYRPWYDPTPYVTDKMYCKWGSFIDDVDKFDAEFFNISPREAQMMDPQLRLLLQVLYGTMEDAGYAGRIRGTHTGMYVGACFQDYKDRLPQTVDPHSGTGNASTMLANRPSFYFNLLGPSVFIDTACSSSLVALHLACRALRNQECEMAFVAGTNLLLSSHHYRYFCSIGALSATGRCHTFDAAADGYVPGEGVGAVLLKPLQQALRDGDRVHAVIKGTAINHGGYTPSITAPSMLQEAKVIMDAWKDAEINPTSIGYIEAHGTGTKLGDPVEINALKEAFKPYPGQGEAFCAVGSAKAHIGHAEGAAGITGLLKAILSLQHKEIPAMPRFHELNPYIKLESSPLYINREVIPWESVNGEPRRAGVSSFGFGGAYAHVVVEEYVSPSVDESQLHTLAPHVIVMSALNRDRLTEQAARLIAYVEKYNASLCIDDIAFTLQTGRQHMEERLAFVAADLTSLVRRLQAFINGAGVEQGIHFGNVKQIGSSLELMLGGASGKDFIRSIQSHDETYKLAQLWVWGAQIDWYSLWPERVGKVVSLPTYPFAKKRHWAAEDQPQPHSSGSLLSIGNLHVERSMKESGLVFETVVAPEDSIMSDHLVHGLPTMPAAVFLDMASQAAALIAKGKEFHLMDVVLARALTADTVPKKIEFVMKTSNAGTQFEVRSPGKHSEIHVQGLIGMQPSLKLRNSVNLQERMEIADSTIEAEQLYDAFRNLGIQYGPFFESVRKIWIKGDQALCYLEAPEGGAGSFHQIHPSLLDGALQGIIGIFAAKGIIEPYLPFSIDELIWSHSIQGSAYALITTAEKDKFDIELTDAQGKVGVHISGLRIRKARDPLASLLYVPKWERDPNEIREHAATSRGKRILIAAAPGWERFSEALGRYHMDDSVVVFSLTHESLSEQQAGAHPFFSGEDAPEIIYFLVGFSDIQERVDAIGLEQSQEYGIIALYRLFRAWSKIGYLHQSVQLKVVTNRAFAVEGDEASPFTGGIFGFVKSIAREYLNWNIHCLDVSFDLQNENEGEIRSAAEAIVRENEKFHGEIAFRSGKRYKRMLYPIVLPPAEKSAFKQEGVYFIAGGAGGIGIELCRFLSRHYRAKLVLIGRRSIKELTASTQSMINEFGADLLYLTADLANQEEMEEAAATAKRRFGKIDGVIHSALVLKDCSLEALEEETLLEVMRPKAAGSIELYEVFKNEPLDFMLFFSSVQSFSGNAGQSNYAAACSFKDAIANYIREKVSYPVHIVNWGYWGSVGVVANDSYQKRLAAQGLYSIDPMVGMEAIVRTLAWNIPQLIAINADVNVIKGIGGKLDATVVVPAEQSASIPHARLNISERPKMGTKHVRKSLHARGIINEFGQQMLMNAFQRMGVFLPDGEAVRADELQKKLGIIPQYSRLLEGLLQIAAAAGHIEDQGTYLSGTSTATSLDELAERKKQWCDLNPDIRPQLELIWECVRHYPEILTGQVPAENILFPEGSMELVGSVYQGNADSDYYNGVAAWALQRYVELRLPDLKQGSIIKILEIGAGTGGTSSRILPALQKHRDNLSYTYSDISKAFLKYGQETFGKGFPFVEFKLLNIEKEVLQQGFATGEYDVVIAANVLHATQNIERTLRHVKTLLKPNGWLVINEVTSRMDFLTMTFGLLEGWWLFKDDLRIPHSPLLSPACWKKQLSVQGFRGVTLLADAEEKMEHSQQVIIGESDGLYVVNNPGAIEISATGAALENVAPSTSRIEPPFHTPGLIERLEQPTQDTGRLSQAELQRYVANRLVLFLRMTLKLTDDDIKSEKQFTDYGVDSIMGLEFVKHINEEFGITMRTTALFDYGNVRDLSAYLCKEYGKLIAPHSKEGRHEGPPKSTNPLEKEVGERTQFELLQNLADGKMSGTEVLKLLEVSDGQR